MVKLMNDIVDFGVSDASNTARVRLELQARSWPLLGVKICMLAWVSKSTYTYAHKAAKWSWRIQTWDKFVEVLKAEKMIIFRTSVHQSSCRSKICHMITRLATLEVFSHVIESVLAQIFSAALFQRWARFSCKFPCSSTNLFSIGVAKKSEVDSLIA